MKILVDADACPVKNIIVSVAKKFGIETIMIFDTSHEISDGYSRTITVDKARDSVDLALINIMNKGDIVVTQDYGLAALCLGKGGLALNQNGLIYSDSNIDTLLFERHIGQKVRRSGGKTGNAHKRTKADDEKFESVFLTLVTNNLINNK